MILSNQAIVEAMQQGRLKIDPRPSPERPAPGLTSPYQTSSVDLRLGSEIAFLKPGLTIAMDLRKGKFANLFVHSERIEITEKQPYVLAPNDFVLAKTKERVELVLPTDGNNFTPLAARVEGKSSYARCGMLVHFTAPTIHAGFAGTITLEIINLGPYSINLYPDMYICQLIIEEVSGRPWANESQFQGQNTAAGSKG